MEWGCMQALIDFDGWRAWQAMAGPNTLIKTAGPASAVPATIPTAKTTAPPSPSTRSQASSNNTGSQASSGGGPAGGLFFSVSRGASASGAPTTTGPSATATTMPPTTTTTGGGGAATAAAATRPHASDPSDPNPRTDSESSVHTLDSLDSADSDDTALPPASIDLPPHSPASIVPQTMVTAPTPKAEPVPDHSGRERGPSPGVDSPRSASGSPVMGPRLGDAERLAAAAEGRRRSKRSSLGSGGLSGVSEEGEVGA